MRKGEKTISGLLGVELSRQREEVQISNASLVGPKTGHQSNGSRMSKRSEDSRKSNTQSSQYAVINLGKMA